MKPKKTVLTAAGRTNREDVEYVVSVMKTLQALDAISAELGGDVLWGEGLGHCPSLGGFG